MFATFINHKNNESNDSYFLHHQLIIIQLITKLPFPYREWKGEALP